MSSILVVGDAHVSNNQRLARFEWLGHHVMDTRPDHIVFIGDFLTLNSLSAWDKSKRATMEGRRYDLEIQAGREAMSHTMRPLVAHQLKMKRQKKRAYSPEFIYVEGKHEERLTRFLEEDPTFMDRVGIRKDLRLDEEGWAWVPYRDSISLHGIDFTHVPFNKAKPITGLDINKKCSDVTVNSTVFGHTHEVHYSNYRRHGQDRNQHILNCGCFFEEAQDEEYCDGRIKNYWRGVITLDVTGHGQFDVTTTSMAALEDRYGTAA